MTTMRTIQLFLAVGLLALSAVAQDDSRPSGNAPAPAFGQNAPILSPENPPISGMDEPRLELRTASRSFIAPALQLSESADTNAGNQLGGGGVQAVSRFLGAFDLQQFWSKTDFLAEYLGGGALYSGDTSVRQLHAAAAELITRWRTGQLSMRDSFSYLPEGSFSVGAYGGMPGLGLANAGMGVGGVLPGETGQQGSVGLIPRIANNGVLDVVQTITPRTAITAAGGFGNAHFFDKTNELINSDQTTVQLGVSHLLNRHDQAAVVYGYQLFRFPQVTGGQVQNHIMNLRWGHTITGRLSLIVGAGPQYTIFQGVNIPDNKHWSANGRVQLRYRLERTSLVASYEKFTSAGSGFFAGSDSQVARFAIRHSLTRTMEVFGDFGYSHNKRLGTFANNVGVAGSHYNEGFAGAVVRKHFGRAYDVFAGYRFGEIGFDNASNICGPASGFGACGQLSQRHTGAVGVEWHPTPTRIE